MISANGTRPGGRHLDPSDLAYLPNLNFFIMKLTPHFLAGLVFSAVATFGVAQTPSATAAAPLPPPPVHTGAHADTTAPDPEVVKDAGRIAINSAMTELASNLPSGAGAAKRFAVLPVQGDLAGGYFTLQVRNLFAARCTPRGLELYARDDEEWKGLLNEIAWGQKFADTMDTATVQKFGKIRGVEGLIVGTLSGVSKGRDGEVRVRFNLQVFRVETGQILWSTEKSGVIAPPVEEKSPLLAVQDQPWFSTKIALIAGGAVLGLIVLAVVFGRIKSAARPR